MHTRWQQLEILKLKARQPCKGSRRVGRVMGEPMGEPLDAAEALLNRIVRTRIL